MSITDCKKCVFYTEEDWCSFGIPESITNKEVLVNSDIRTIDNYTCLYAFGKETFETNKNQYSIDQIKEYISERNQICYSVVINFDTTETSSSQIIEKINTCSFKPKNVVCFGKSVDGETVASFEKELKIPWKVNKILPHIDETISIVSGVDVITDKHNSKCFLYISTNSTLENIDEVMNYIHIESVINNNYGIFMSKQSVLDGLFMTYDAYKLLATDKVKFFSTPDLFFKDNPECKLILYND